MEKVGCFVTNADQVTSHLELNPVKFGFDTKRTLGV